LPPLKKKIVVANRAPHLLDVLAPDQDFSLAEFKVLAEKKLIFC
jgi:hypothetical protein